MNDFTSLEDLLAEADDEYGKAPEGTALVSHTATFDELCAIEPRLRELYDEACSYPDALGFCANGVWYNEGGLKERLCRLVGWEAERPELRTCEAYDTGYETIYNALPDCQHGDSMCRG